MYNFTDIFSEMRERYLHHLNNKYLFLDRPLKVSILFIKNGSLVTASIHFFDYETSRQLSEVRLAFSSKSG